MKVVTGDQGLDQTCSETLKYGKVMSGRTCSLCLTDTVFEGLEYSVLYQTLVGPVDRLKFVSTTDSFLMSLVRITF